MFKLILLGFAFYLVYVIFFKKSSIGHKSASKANEPNEMVACHTCQTYTSIDEILLVDGNYYCSKECARENA